MLLVHEVISLFIIFSFRDVHYNVICTANAVTYIYIFFFSKLSTFSGFTEISLTVHTPIN